MGGYIRDSGSGIGNLRYCRSMVAEDGGRSMQKMVAKSEAKANIMAVRLAVS